MTRPAFAEEDTFQQEADQLRQDVHDGYAFVEAQRFTQSFASFTVEEAMDAFVERISGNDTLTRPNAINRVKGVAARVSAAVSKIRALPAETFRAANPDTDVNTSP